MYNRKLELIFSFYFRFSQLQQQRLQYGYSNQQNQMVTSPDMMSIWMENW